MVGVTAKMKYLQGYLASFIVDRPSDCAVRVGFGRRGQRGAGGPGAASLIGRDASGHDESDPAACARRVEGG